MLYSGAANLENGWLEKKAEAQISPLSSLLIPGQIFKSRGEKRVILLKLVLGSIRG